MAKLCVVFLLDAFFWCFRKVLQLHIKRPRQDKESSCVTDVVIDIKIHNDP